MHEGDPVRPGYAASRASFPEAPPLHAADVIERELAAIAASSGNVDDGVEARNRPLLGVSFSGGGIRSATFNLGILQGLGRLRFLSHVDYLSTVSGGGYIGGWFQAWRCRQYVLLRIAHLEQLANISPKPTSTIEGRIDELEWQEQRKSDEAAKQITGSSGARTSWVGKVLDRVGPHSRSSASIETRLRDLEARAGVTGEERAKIADEALEQVQQALGGGSACASTRDDEGRALDSLAEDETSRGTNTARPHSRPARARCREPEQIRFLRDYSNYLTPSAGMLSADTWTLGAIYLRNLALNMIILVLSVSSILLLVHFCAHLFRYALYEPKQQTWLNGISALSCVLAAYSFVAAARMLPPIKASEPHPKRQGRALAALLVSSLLMSLALPGLTGANALETWQLMLFAAIPLCGPLMVLSRRRELLQTVAARSTRLLALRGLVASALAGITGALLLRALAEQVSRQPSKEVLLGGPLVLCIITVMMVVQLAVLGRGVSEYLREWAGRLSAHLLLWAVGTFAVLAIALKGADLLKHTLTIEGGLATLPPLLLLAITVAGMIAAQVGGAWEESKLRALLISVAPPAFCIGALVYLSAAVHGVLEQTNGLWSPVGLSVSEDSLHTCLNALMLATVAAAGSIGLSWSIGVNEFSLHALYRNRLVRCYLGAARADGRSADTFTGFDPDDDAIRIDELTARGVTTPQQDGEGLALRPYLLINATLNLVVGQRLAWQFRRASSFLFSPLYSGYETRHPAPSGRSGGIVSGLFNAGYRPTQHYGDGISLGTAVAISGAALSPNMGARTSPAMAFLLTLFNVRLGWWLGNPRHPTAWRRAGPALGLVHLLLELVGKANDDRKFVYLSDGGHFENLGLYELVRRRCRYIVVCDAGDDHALTFGDLGNAIEKCRVDFDTEIDIDVSPLLRDPATGFSKSHCAVGQIRYDRHSNDGFTGTLLYVKATITGCETADIRTFAKTNPRFPHQSTTDQWFDEAQFESYRKLGEHIALQIFDPAGTRRPIVESCEVLFTRIRHCHLAPAPGRQAAFSQHALALNGLYEQLRTSPQLSYLDAELCPEWEAMRTARIPSLRPWPEYSSGLRLNTEVPERSEAERRAGFYFCQQLIQLMECVYLDLQLDTHHDHPDNRGWMNLFHHWAWSDTLCSTWAVVGCTMGVRFQSFCERNIGLQLGGADARVKAISIECTEQVKLSNLMDGIEAAGLTLSAHERELFTQLSQAKIRHCEENTWKAFAAILRVRGRRDKLEHMQFPVASGLVRGTTLVFLRTRNHLRKAGLARDVILRLRDDDLVQDCELLDRARVDARAPFYERGRYQHQWTEILRERDGRVKAAAE